MAKITDMGNSRIVRPGQVARTLSALPGTLVYMPPEAQDDTHRYGPPLDVFSFGHLALFTFIQVSLDEIAMWLATILISDLPRRAAPQYLS